MAGRRAIFVSCGQLTHAEKTLGRAVAAVIERHSMTAFFAQDVHSAGDLNSEVFKAIQTCDAFLGILQRRGVVQYADFPPVERSSVWIQQEFAVFCYRMFLERRSLPIRVYAERGIRREGLMEIAIVNPIDFDRDDEVITGVDVWLTSHEFQEHPILARREALFQHRIAQTTEEHLLLLEFLAAHCVEPDDSAEPRSVEVDFFAALRVAGQADQQIERNFAAAYSGLRSLGFIRQLEDGRVCIEKQWWQLILDELRRRGRRL